MLLRSLFLILGLFLLSVQASASSISCEGLFKGYKLPNPKFKAPGFRKKLPGEKSRTLEFTGDEFPGFIAGELFFISQADGQKLRVSVVDANKVPEASWTLSRSGKFVNINHREGYKNEVQLNEIQTSQLFEDFNNIQVAHSHRNLLIAVITFESLLREKAPEAFSFAEQSIIWPKVKIEPMQPSVFKQQYKREFEPEEDTLGLSKALASAFKIIDGEEITQREPGSVIITVEPLARKITVESNVKNDNGEDILEYTVSVTQAGSISIKYQTAPAEEYNVGPKKVRELILNTIKYLNQKNDLAIEPVLDLEEKLSELAQDSQ